MFTTLTLNKGQADEMEITFISDTLEGAIQEARNFSDMNGYTHFTVGTSASGFVFCYGND